MSKIIFITGTSTGFGKLMTITFSAAGHIIIAGMRGTTGKDAAAARELAARDPDGLPTTSPEIDWYVPGDTALPWIGRRSRRSEVASYFRTMWPQFAPGKSTASVEKLILTGNDAVMLGTFAHSREHRPVLYHPGGHALGRCRW